MEKKYPPWEIYKTLDSVVNYRNLERVDKILNEEDFKKTLENKEYVTIDSKNISGDRTVFVITYPGSKYESKSPEFIKLVNSILDFKKKTAAVFSKKVSILMITFRPFTNYIKTHSASLMSRYPNLEIKNHSSDMFLIDIFKHNLVPKQTIADEEEVKYLCDLYFTDKENFSGISVNDPICVFLGAKKGQVIKSERKSETVGETSYYRYVV